MKRIINGKVYNTETATLIGEWSNNRGHGDFSNMSEDLYLTKKGQYFIAGSGGPMTKYAKSCGNNCSTGSDDIYLLTPAEARTWFEDGEMELDEMAEFFQGLIDSGMAWQLQGMYGRTAMQLVEAGLCVLPQR